MSTRRKPTRKKRPQAARVPEHESFVFAGGSMERHGRFIYMQTAADEDAHERFVDGSVARIPEIEARREQRLVRLRDVLVQAGPADCLAFASLTYLQKDPDTYRESEDDRSSAHVEFMALQVLPLLTQARPGQPSFEDVQTLTGEALHLVRDVFEDTKELLVLRSVEASRRPGASPPFEAYRLEAMSQALSVRGTAFAEHTWSVLVGLFAPFDADCRKILGFTAREAWSLMNAIPAVIEPRLRPRLTDAAARYRDAERDLNRRRRKHGLPPALAAMTPTQQKAWLRQATFGQAYRDPVSLALLTPQTLAAAAGVSVPACAAWLEMLHCPPSEYIGRYHRAPTGGHPLTRLPLVRLDTGYLAPVPSALAEALRPRMEDAIRERDQAVWDRYEAHRGRWVEETATERLKAALPGSARWVGIPWSGTADSSDLDGLVHCDDLALRIQAKAGRISAPARRGAPSMVEDVTAVVSDAMHQHSRLTRALGQQTPEQLGFDPDQAAAFAAPLQIEVVVSLDDITVWSTETHKLRHLVAVPAIDQVPWVLSLPDLMATTDLLSGAQLAHFLTRRQRLEREGRIEAHDELDWVGNYIFDGLFFDRFFEGPEPADMVRLNSYTEAIDSWYFSREGLTAREVPRPTQPIPPNFAGLLARLEHDRPPHWVKAGIMLLNGDAESRNVLSQFLTHTAARALEVGWSNASQALGPYGITLWVDHRYAGGALSRLLSGYADQKIRELNRPNWLVIALGADGRLAVVVRETQPDLTLIHVLLQRDH